MWSTANFVFIASTRDLRPIHKVAATYQLGQPSLIKVANWINQNTGVNSIVATNLFFGEGSIDYCDVPEGYLLDPPDSVCPYCGKKQRSCSYVNSLSRAWARERCAKENTPKPTKR